MMDRATFLGHKSIPNVGVRQATVKDFSSVIRLYEEWGYGGTYTPGDEIWLAEAGSETIGLVRLVKEQELRILRGMYVTPQWRGNRVASTLLASITANLTEPCWCIPYAHLVEFYRQAGFVPVPEAEAPVFLQERLGRYRWTGRDYQIMCRPVAG